jgi:uncharacterized membrane protein
MDHLQNELKKEFQIERMILFSDAVFAIALTLLVIDLKVPEISKQTVTDGKLLDALNELIPKFFGFSVSFVFIGSFWIIHHRMFGYVVNYDRKLLVLNLVFLFSIVLMPFSTAFFSAFFLRILKTPYIFYASNILFLSVMNTLLWRHISNPKNKLSEDMDPRVVRYHLVRSIVMPFMFLSCFLAYMFFPPKYAVMTALIAAIVMRRVIGMYSKKVKKQISHPN